MILSVSAPKSLTCQTLVSGHKRYWQDLCTDYYLCLYLVFIFVWSVYVHLALNKCYNTCRWPRPIREQYSQYKDSDTPYSHSTGGSACCWHGNKIYVFALFCQNKSIYIIITSTTGLCIYILLYYMKTVFK